MEIWKMQTFKRITGIFTTVVLVAVLLLLMLLAVMGEILGDFAKTWLGLQ